MAKKTRKGRTPSRGALHWRLVGTAIGLGLWIAASSHANSPEASSVAGRVAPPELTAEQQPAAWLWLWGLPTLLLLSLAGSARYLAIKRRAAYYDPLTGLPNRTFFLIRLDRALTHASRKRACAVLCLKLDRFQNLNSSMGHSTGDELLVEAAARLRASVRGRDTVAHLAADEFAVLIEGLKVTAAARVAAKRIQARISEPFELTAIEVYTSAGMGISISHGSYQNPEHLLRDASTAMHRSTAGGPGSQRLFEPAMHSRSMKILRLETELRRAIEEQELELYYQPIYRLPGGPLTGFEALLRWQHPEQGLLLPGEFLDIADHTGFIQRIESWSLPAACKQLRAWLDAFPAAGRLSISVNLAGRQFLRGDLLDLVADALASSSLEPSQLCLEITENTIMEQPRRVIEVLSRLRCHGVELYLDDFGTGHSSLSYLQRFPVTCLKIDRSFVRRADRQPANAVILRTITELGHNLGLEVIAEGVETEGELAMVEQLGCEMAQGFLLSEPLTAKQVEQLLQSCKPAISRSA